MCKFLYIIRTGEKPGGSGQPLGILYIIMMRACAGVCRATVVMPWCVHGMGTLRNFSGGKY